MKSRYIIILFLIAAAGIWGTYYLVKNHPEEAEKTIIHAKTVVPKTEQETEATEEEKSEADFLHSYVELNPNETLITSIFIDFNNDTFEDEVDIIRVAGKDNFYIVPAIFNKATTKYERLPEIQTDISRAGSVSLQGLDVIGNHVNAIVFQGINDKNLSVMQIYQFFMTNPLNKMEGEISLIGNFESDVMVFIQTVDRNEAYDFDTNAPGASYTVWVHKIDPEDKSSNPGQVQQEFRWNVETLSYQLESETKIPASRLEAAELSKLQGGNLDAYGEFLNGLWIYGSGKVKKYIYFDYPNREIIQVSPDIQSIFTWGQSQIRKNGIYINSVNTMITNLRRRIDVSLVNLDEIRLIIRDDVNMNIEQDTALDGYYKRLNVSTFAETQKEEASIDRIVSEIEKGPAWISGDYSTNISFQDHIYTLESLSGVETGIYSTLSTGSADMIQFRSTSGNSQMGKSYTMKFGTKTVVNKRGKEIQEEDIDTIILQPADIYADGSYDLQNNELVLTRYLEETAEEESN